MPKINRKAGKKGGLARYFAPRMFAVAWIAALGALACTVFNLASRHGVLSPYVGGNAGKPSVRPAYGEASSAGLHEDAGKPAKKSGRAKAIDPTVNASAYVLVRNNIPVPAGNAAVKVEPEVPAELVVITLAEATKYVESRAAIFVDARSAQRFSMGHIPGAMNVPSSDFDRGFERNAPRLPKDGKIVVYCESASCDQAEDVANKLLQKGYRKVLHFKDGWLVWEFSDQVQEKGAEQ